MTARSTPSGSRRRSGRRRSRCSTPADFERHPELVRGYIGPQALADLKIRYLADPRVVEGTRWITGANREDVHVANAVAGRDFTVDATIEAAEIRAGDTCPVCGGALVLDRGIEIGHIFQLGTYHSDVFDLSALGPEGKPVRVTMGSYGIGVSRAVGAIAEQTLDDSGLRWPRAISPADVHVVATGKDQAIFDAAETLVGDLESRGVRVIFDDRRGVSPGVKFNDAELIGVPTIVIVGRGLADGHDRDQGPDHRRARGHPGRGRGRAPRRDLRVVTARRRAASMR